MSYAPAGSEEAAACVSMTKGRSERAAKAGPVRYVLRGLSKRSAGSDGARLILSGPECSGWPASTIWKKEENRNLRTEAHGS